jgi:hypothetical protein
MIKRLPFSLLALFLAFSFFLSSCSPAIEGTGPVINKKLVLTEFRSIELEIPAVITVAMSDSVQGVIRAQSNIADLIELQFDGDELIIKSKEDYSTSKPVELILSARELEKLTINGSGDIKVINPIRGEELKLVINGSGNISVQTSVTKLRTDINGSGDINIEGKAVNHRIRMNGSGNVMAGNLQTENTDIHINGSGDADLTANLSLEAKIMGSGNVTYQGTPKVDADITGSGEVSKK